MEESDKNGPSSAKKAKVAEEGDDENSHESGGFAPCSGDETDAIFDQDTEPYNIESCESNENLFGGGGLSPTLKNSENPLREQAGTPEIEIEVNEKLPNMKRIESVFEDAKLITGIVDGIDVESVYKKLKSRRGCLLYTSPSPRD